MRTILREFQVRAEDGDERATLLEIQDSIPAGTHEDPRARIPGPKYLRRKDTRDAFNWLDDGRYREVQSGRIFLEDVHRLR